MYIIPRRMTDLICAYIEKLLKLVLKCSSFIEVDLFKLFAVASVIRWFTGTNPVTGANGRSSSGDPVFAKPIQAKCV